MFLMHFDGVGERSRGVVEVGQACSGQVGGLVMAVEMFRAKLVCVPVTVEPA